VEVVISSKRRILFIGEAVTLAHVARPLTLASMLDTSRYDITFACDARYDSLIDTSPFRREIIHSIPGEQFLKSLAGGGRLYDKATLDEYVNADLKLIQACQPDLVVGDFRLSLSISARLAGKPYLTISNAYWSPYARPHFTVPELPLVKLAGVALGQQIFDLVRPVAFRYHALPLNQLRKRYGLPTLGLDLRRVYTDADYTLYNDIPQLVPTYDLPDTHAYVGPSLWSPACPLPDWWASLPTDRPLVYVTLGSSGGSGMLPLVLQALAGEQVIVIAACAGRNRPRDIPANAFVADYLPGEQAAARAALVISNGGSLTSYQALAYGKPVVGIASNLDQYLNMQYLESIGAGKLIRTGSATLVRIADAARETLGNVKYVQAAHVMQQLIATYPAHEVFKRVLDQAFTRGETVCAR
jgi:UDP:flavonoid glycosyltransferase YjiC (YdhE family)